MDVVCHTQTDTLCNTCDEILIYYQKKKQELYYNVYNGLDVFDIDRQCTWNLGKIIYSSLENKMDNLRFNVRKFKCKNCTMFPKLIGSIHLPIDNKIYCKAINKKLILIKEESIGLSIKENDESNILRYISSFQEKDEPVCNNYNTKNVIKYIKSDVFTSEIIINWFLCQVIPDKLRSIYVAFICGDNSYKLIEDINSINMNMLPTDKILSVIYQIFSILKNLEPYDFSISLKSVSNLFIIDENYQIKINNLNGSSITIYDSMSENGIRIYSDENYYITDVKVGRSMYSDINFNKRILYQISNLDNLLKIINSGSPFYKSSLNVYIILIYLLSFKKIREYIYSYEETYELFKGLWLPLEFKQLSLNLLDLERFKLRCDALNFFHQGLTSIINKHK